MFKKLFAFVQCCTLFTTILLVGCSDDVARLYNAGIDSDYVREDLKPEEAYSYPPDDAIEGSDLNPLKDAKKTEEEANSNVSNADEPANLASNADANTNTSEDTGADNSDDSSPDDLTQADLDKKSDNHMKTLPREGEVETNASIERIKPVAQDSNYYIVSYGDTLYSIAARFGVSLETLKRVNNIIDDNVRIGQPLILPKELDEKIGEDALSFEEKKKEQPAILEAKKSNDNKILKIKKAALLALEEKRRKTKQNTKNGLSVKQKQKVNQKKPQELSKNIKPKQSHKLGSKKLSVPRLTGIKNLRWPVHGRVIRGFGKKHGLITSNGIDISVPENTLVKAAENGVVIYVGEGLKEFGRTILIKHQNNIVTVYGNNSHLLVHRGQAVHRGQEIAKSGKSGNAKTPQLHFEVRKDSIPIDPMKYLKK